jgi:hypothetical protein
LTSGGEGLRRKRPTRTTKGTLVQLNQQKVREKVLPNLSAALKAAAMAMGSRWMEDDTILSVGGFEDGSDSQAGCATREGARNRGRNESTASEEVWALESTVHAWTTTY